MTQSKFGRKSDAVFAALAETKLHPSAESLYQRLREEYPNISQNTIYRNLARFREEGTAVCVAVVNGQERFDANTVPHPHFICDRCGAVLDMDLAVDPPGLDKAAAGLTNLEVRSHELVFRGLCQDCSKS